MIVPRGARSPLLLRNRRRSFPRPAAATVDARARSNRPREGVMPELLLDRRAYRGADARTRTGPLRYESIRACPSRHPSSWKTAISWGIGGSKEPEMTHETGRCGPGAARLPARRPHPVKPGGRSGYHPHMSIPGPPTNQCGSAWRRRQRSGSASSPLPTWPSIARSAQRRSCARSSRADCTPAGSARAGCTGCDPRTSRTGCVPPSFAPAARRPGRPPEPAPMPRDECGRPADRGYRWPGSVSGRTGPIIDETGRLLDRAQQRRGRSGQRVGHSASTLGVR